MGIITPLAAQTEWESIMAQMKAERVGRRALRPRNTDALFAALSAAGITSISVEFDGAGDQGQIEHVLVKRGATTVELPDQPTVEIALHVGNEVQTQTTTLGTALEHIVYDCLEETHDGWEINDGAFGEFTFDVAARSIELAYNERDTTITSYEHAFGEAE